MISEPSHSVGRKLLSGSVLRVGNLVGAAASSFFLMPLIVHHLGDRIYGFWSLAAAFIGYYNLLDLGLSSAVSQYMCIAIGRRDDTECRVVFNTALRLQFMIGAAALLITAILAMAAPQLSHHPAEVPEFRNVIIILGINAALGFPARVYWATLESELRFDIQSWLGIIQLVLRTGLIVWAVLAGGGLLALAWMALLSTLPVTAAQVWLARREAPWARVNNAFVQKDRIKDFFSYSVYSFLAYIADVVRFQLDPLVISALLGLAAVTHYKVAGILTQYYLQIIVATVGMLLPVFSRMHGAGDRRGLEGAFFFGTKLSCCISMFVCAGLVGWGRPFIDRWMGRPYEDGYWPLVVLAFAVLIDVSQKSSSDLLFATFNHKGYAWINCAEALINLGCSIALARPLGIMGVALGTFIGAFVIRVIGQPWWVCKVSGFSYLHYMRFLIGTLLRCGIIAGGCIAVVIWGLRPNYAWLGLSAFAAAALYAAGGWLLVLNDTERQQFVRVFRRRTLGPDAQLVAIGEAGQG